METKIPESTRLAFIGCGVMAESMIAGLLRQKIVAAEQIVASHPRAERRDELFAKHRIDVFEHNADAVRALPENGVALLCVKPQRLGGVLKELAGIVKPAQLIVSIIAGARIEKISEALANDLHRVVLTCELPGGEQVAHPPDDQGEHTYPEQQHRQHPKPAYAGHQTKSAHHRWCLLLYLTRIACIRYALR